MPDSDILDAAVVGAGWAGLGVSHALAGAGLRHRVLERARIGETWRTQRWDSFRMNTPNVQTVMPGDRYDGPDPEGVMTRDAFVTLLESFAVRHRLPVAPGTPVTELVAQDGVYRLATPGGTLSARNVVIASGSQNRPRRPPAAASLPPGLHQIDASGYRNAAALPNGAVLVVGNAQSGGQIAEDLAEAGRTVFLATGRVGRIPRRYRGRDVSIWLIASGLFDQPRQDLAPGRCSARCAPSACSRSAHRALRCSGAAPASRTAASPSLAISPKTSASPTSPPPPPNATSTTGSSAPASTPPRRSPTRRKSSRRACRIRRSARSTRLRRASPRSSGAPGSVATTTGCGFRASSTRGAGRCTRTASPRSPASTSPASTSPPPAGRARSSRSPRRPRASSGTS
jgi:hypothetical protein